MLTVITLIENTVMKTQLLALTATSTFLFAASLEARPPQMPTPPPADEVVVEMFASYDTDESDTLSEDELVAAFVGIRSQRMAQMSKDGLCQRPARAGSGRGQGARGPGKGRGPVAAQNFVPTLIERFDADEDSSLNTEEALAAVSYLHENRGPRGLRALQAGTNLETKSEE